MITADPLRNAPNGAQLKISADLFKVSAPVELAGIENWDFFNGAVLAIHFGAGSEQRILGSGVLVAPGVALTARHVIEPELERILAGELEIICTGIAPSGLMIWRCHQVVLLDDTDVALITVVCASDLPDVLRQAAITTRLPRVGERLMIAGVRHGTGDPVSISRPAALSMMVAVGTVTARFETGRDRVMLPGPSIEVDCPALGGMSGGPAFNEDGFLLGLITSSIEGEPGGPAFLSLVWPALAHRITPCWPGGLYKEPISLLEMHRLLCAIDRPEAVEMVEDSDGKRIVYRPWES